MLAMTKTCKNLENQASSVIPDEIMSEMLLAIPANAPPPSVAKRIKARLFNQVSRQNIQRDRDTDLKHAGIRTVRIDSSDWLPFAPSASMRTLSVNGHMHSWMARLEPGARLPGHDHPDVEECLVLQGSCYVGDLLLHEGDYQVALKGTRHGEVYSPQGCLLFLRSAIESTDRTAACFR